MHGPRGTIDPEPRTTLQVLDAEKEKSEYKKFFFSINILLAKLAVIPTIAPAFGLLLQSQNGWLLEKVPAQWTSMLGHQTHIEDIAAASAHLKENSSCFFLFFSISF